MWARGCLSCIVSSRGSGPCRRPKGRINPHESASQVRTPAPKACGGLEQSPDLANALVFAQPPAHPNKTWRTELASIRPGAAATSTSGTTNTSCAALYVTCHEELLDLDFWRRANARNQKLPHHRLDWWPSTCQYYWQYYGGTGLAEYI